MIREIMRFCLILGWISVNIMALHTITNVGFLANWMVVSNVSVLIAYLHGLNLRKSPNEILEENT